ncbi:RAD9, HUS1, RAD1-interacting nuclear orphan protein 1 isoform X2 [Triplophysa rosa]|uniref:RAD9, HUS1, RAD1-interacting nuclear orphan protein 1 isoform X2 n=1 Tax=Triplophysa rosa TaxID=992332 RepID=UPI00254637D0|nr:RAD9, HUS1, RAD1-interacting nuclear orphan protein 1 isoform X2 [Triplophysa rosa]
MPRVSSKRRLLNPNKSQLLFEEAPINGPKHDCGPQLPSAIHPRTCISEKQQRANAQRSLWVNVSPQFSSHDIKAVSRGRESTRGKSNTVMGLSFHHNRPTAVCKYSPLSFETNTAVSQHPHKNTQTKTTIQQPLKEVRCSRAKKDRQISSSNLNKELVETPKRTPSLRKGVKRSTAQSVVRPGASRRTELPSTPPHHENEKRTPEGFVHTPVSKEGQTPNTISVPAPLEVETPEMPHCSSASSASVSHLLFPPNQAKTPPRTENTSVLVEDTPEKDYGLRVTWRRRKGLMKVLMDRGKLLVTDTEVANEWI